MLRRHVPVRVPELDEEGRQQEGLLVALPPLFDARPAVRHVDRAAPEEVVVAFWVQLVEHDGGHLGIVNDRDAIAWILVDLGTALGSTTGRMGTTAAMSDTTGDDDQRIDDLDKTIDDARKPAEDHGTIPDSDPDPTFVDPDGDGDPD